MGKHRTVMDCNGTLSLTMSGQLNSGRMYAEYRCDRCTAVVGVVGGNMEPPSVHDDTFKPLSQKEPA